MIGLTRCMESCVSCFYFTYCRFNELKSPIRIRGIFQRAYTKPGLQRPTKYRARAAVVSTIIKRLYFPLSHVCKIRSYFKLLLLLLLLLLSLLEEN